MMGAVPIIMPAVGGLMVQSRSHSWSPIEDLPGNWQELIDTRVTGLAQAWQDQSVELKENAAIREFVARLCRQFAIETGAIEQIYHITQSATETLIEHGLNGALLSHGDTLEPIDLVMARIEDQHQAIKAVYEFVASGRSLGTWYIKALHEIVTANQTTHTVRDSLGQLAERPLLRGQWKVNSNSVKRTDGYHFEYCPPEQVASEIDRLLEMHAAHLQAGVSPMVEAAWLHHRFVLIHPFADGNGRMARLLASMVLLRAGYLPLVVTRPDKPAYIEALEEADDGNLSALVAYFGTLQMRMLRQGLSVGEATLQGETNVADALADLRQRLRAKPNPNERRAIGARGYADALQADAMKRIESMRDRVEAILREANSPYTLRLSGAQSVENLRWTEHGPQPAASEDWCRVWIAWELTDGTNRHVLLFPFREFGEPQGSVISCDPQYWKSKSADGSDSESPLGLTNEPFSFTYASNPLDLHNRFLPWLDACIVNGIRFWTHAIA